MADAGRPTSALLRQHSMPVAMPSSMQPTAPVAPASAPSIVSPTTTSLGLSGYTQLQEIGAGTFGKVWKVRRNEDQAILVWKELKYGSMNEKEKKQLVDEVNILRDLNHKNIVKYHDRIIDREKKTIYIVMEHCSGGDIAGIIAERKKSRIPIEEDFIWQVLGEISSALEQCHKKCNGVILHRDLKPANIFLDNPVTKCVKLGDFGLARTLKNSFDYAQTHVGTPYYMSPEQVGEKKYNEKSDIWSLGCLIYEMAALSVPFNATSHLALARKIEQGVYERLPQRHGYSAQLEGVIRAMIQVDQSKRMSVEEVLRVVEERQRQKAAATAAAAAQAAQAADAATHRRRNSLTSDLTGIMASAQIGSSAAAAAANNNTAGVNVNLLLAQNSQLQAENSNLQRQLKESRAREDQLRQQVMQMQAAQHSQQKNAYAYRVPLTNVSNFAR